MPKVQTYNLPEEALLNRYAKSGAYTDCYCVELPFYVSHEQYVLAFYSTGLFKLERLVLKLALKGPSTDEQASALALGNTDEYAAWTVEDRCRNQLLLCDIHKRTRSWLMTEAIEGSETQDTRLFFGSAVVPVRSRRTGKESLGFVFKALLGVHRLYSVALLSSAARKLIKQQA
ncbi:MAG: hypothetical protein AB8G18_18400 [Gammaproteobacteria bacterium]